ncbi:MAG: sodium:solute symporter family protein [Pirellulales bacterium]|nr:sodium:solute symporter family protein [Pirellulales bacterium]
MLLTPIDWAIIAVYLVGCMTAGIWMRRYVTDVEDFAVAGRKMDMHLGIASLAATELGIVTVMYTAEMGFKNGLAGAVPGLLGCLAMLTIGLTGFVIVPLRNAGVITIPELFEKRFGKRVRWLAGVVVILGGLLNMGIFLRLGGDFLVYVSGLDPKAAVQFNLLGHEFHAGYLEITMTALLGLVLLYTVLGGMLSVLVTDYIQFLVMGLGLVVTSIVVIWNIGWPNLISGLEYAHQNGSTYVNTLEPSVLHQTSAARLAESGILLDTSNPTHSKTLVLGHPFDPIGSSGPLWFCWQAIFVFAIMTTWQTTISRVLSARDAATAKGIYRRTAFYYVGRFALPGLWGAAAFLYFCSVGGLPEGTGSLTAMPQFLGRILPVGVMGLLVAAMLAAEMSTDSGYLLTWATVIYNDIISPCRRKPMSQRAKLLTVRATVVAIGVFLLLYGLWYELPGRAWDYLAVTGNIYLASLFTLLVSGIYWRHANSWGAIAAIVLGAIGPITFLVVNATVKDPVHQISPELAGLSAFGLAFGGMIVGSLLGRALGHGRSGPLASHSNTLEVAP